MISTGFAYGERSKIADAYASMYAPKRRVNESCESLTRREGINFKNTITDIKNESCNCGEGCSCSKSSKKLQTSHKVPKKTGSKLGVRKVLPFDKRDAKPSAKRFSPKVKKVSESTRYFCIADGDKVLCTNDIGESYFNKGGICGDMRIYESKISAMKDISKIKSRRNPNSKYKVRTCECIGESIRFADRTVGHPVNEGLWDMVSNIGSGVANVAKAGLNTVGGGLKAAGNLAQGNFKQAGEDALGGITSAGNNLKDAGGNALNAGGAALGTVSDTASAVGGVAKSAGNALQGNFKQAGEDLMGAGSDALGAVADGAREADVSGAAGKALDVAKNAAGAVGNAAVQGAKAVGNTIQAGNNVVGGGLKAAGNAMQGNFSQAAGDIKDGAMQGKQSLSDAGTNMANAATNSNGQQQTQQQGASNGLEPKVINGSNDSVKNYMKQPGSQQNQQGGQQPAQQNQQDGQQQDKEQRKKALKLQIANLQKEYDNLV